MSDMHINSDGPVILSAPIADDCHCVMYIFTPPALRGQDLMRGLFQRHMDWADENGMRLLLILDPEDGVDPARLRKFYEGHGFEFGDRDDLDHHAIRTPKI